MRVDWKVFQMVEHSALKMVERTVELLANPSAVLMACCSAESWDDHSAATRAVCWACVTVVHLVDW